MVPQVSVIVPIFNVEAYLGRSIESLQKQTMPDIQIILVNDGSTDGSLSICQEYAKNDSRIQVIDKPNGGVSSARNAGLEAATGEYIGFVDPDDWVEPTMYEKMYDTVTGTQADLCMCNYLMEYAGRSVSVTLPIECSVLHGQDIIESVVANMLAGATLNSGAQTIMGSVWRLLIKREFIEKHGLRFVPGVPLMEDLIFCVETLLKCNTVSIDSGQYYHYIIRSNSAVRKYRPDMFDQLHKVYDMLHSILEKEGVYNTLKERMDIRYVNMYLRLVANEAHLDNDSSLTEKVEVIQQYCKDDRLRGILGMVSTKGYTLRKRLVLTALEREWALFLLAYYTILTRLIQK